MIQKEVPETVREGLSAVARRCLTWEAGCCQGVLLWVLSRHLLGQENRDLDKKISSNTCIPPKEGTNR